MAGFMEDAAQAALWASTHAAQFKCDPGRFYLMGHSAGAHLAALVTLDKRHFAATGRLAPRIAGVIGLSGPYDFLPLTDPDFRICSGRPRISGLPTNQFRASRRAADAAGARTKDTTVVAEEFA